MRRRPFVAPALALASVLLAQGCISTVFSPASGPGVSPRPPVEPWTVRVLSEPPPGAFTVLGEIEAVVTGYYSDETVVGRIREAAARKGANAVVLVRDVSTKAAAADSDPDIAWRKRHSLVYSAIVLPATPAP